MLPSAPSATRPLHVVFQAVAQLPELGSLAASPAKKAQRDFAARSTQRGVRAPCPSPPPVSLLPAVLRGHVGMAVLRNLALPAVTNAMLIGDMDLDHSA